MRVFPQVVASLAAQVTAAASLLCEGLACTEKLEALLVHSSDTGRKFIPCPS